MALKHSHFLYWILSVFCFLLIAVVFYVFHQLNSQQSETLDPINITTAIKVMPGRYYQSKGHYHLDMDGASLMTLPVKNLPDNLNKYNTLVIQNFNGFRATHVYLTAQLSTNPKASPINFKQRLISSRHSINPLPQQWRNAHTISEVALVVEPNVSLGFDFTSGNEVSWKTIQFTGNHQINPSQQILSNMTAFIPLTYSSTNVFNKESNSLLKVMIMALGMWLLINVSLFILIRPTALHLLISIALPWLLVSTLYGYNFYQQTIFNQHRYAEHGPYLNQFDRRLSEMAKRIHKSIGIQGERNSTKIMIIGADNFDRKRLNYHLLQHNVGIIGDLEVLLDNLKPENHYAVLLPPYNDLCETNQQQSRPDTLQILLKTSRFCLVQ